MFCSNKYPFTDCYGPVIAELVSAKTMDLNITIEEVGGAKLAFLNKNHCQHVKQLGMEAHTISTCRTTELKNKNELPNVEEMSSETSKQDSKNLKSKKENKICWSCSAEPDEVTLLRCKGCRKAWYCDDECQEEDWDRHGPWCQRRMVKREEKNKAQRDLQRAQHYLQRAQQGVVNWVVSSCLN